ncbi:hypothetical protein [Sphingomonas sp. 3-13AW]|uniref:hypothetical protein n=1 Tax=Sphingomonas sp. 3-13AW TaxID=3050450 RepID=UPI003BB54ED4
MSFLEVAMAVRALSSSDRLRHLAIELESLADAMERPSRSTARSDMLIAECERIACDVRAVVRGPVRSIHPPLWHQDGLAAC